MWWKKKIPIVASVYFPGTMPPRPDEFSFLSKAGVTIGKKDETPAGWNLELTHPNWGKAEVYCLREASPLPQALIEYAPLSPEERAEAERGGCSISLKMEPAHDNVLRDRKLALRYLHALMGADGVLAIDHISTRLWTRAALADELSHDADLDVDGIFTVHFVHDDDQKVFWLHSHGLGEIGAFDFDILQPSEDVCGMAGSEILRALAFAIVEGNADSSMQSFPLARPGGEVRFVDVNVFHANADRAYTALRDNDDAHNAKRAVLCDPGAGGFFSRLLGRSALRPSRFLSGTMPENMVLMFTDSASGLMAQRAKDTYGMLRKLADEFAEFKFPVILKLGYIADGTEDEREHIWFESHQLLDDKIDATCANAPYNVARLKEGQRGMHPTELISDWMIMTPAGAINPRSTLPARFLRSRKDELREAMKNASSAE